MQIIELLSLVHLPFDEIEPHDIRIGWSEQHAPYQLGEAPHSYAYCATGRKALNSVFTDYGETFAIGDTITCCMVSACYYCLIALIYYCIYD
jgi:heterogeneous nuclear ribonucleoprotein U-like protein 1